MNWQELWQSSCPDNAQTDEDIAFSELFEQLQSEVEKSSSLHCVEPTDWKVVLELASSVLSEQGKDLWAYCYGTRAAFEVEGMSGVAIAFALLHEACVNSWEGLHPSAKKIARRAAPFQWLVDKLEPVFASYAFSGGDAATYEALQGHMSQLQDVLDEKLGDAAPSFRSMLRRIPVSKTPATFLDNNDAKDAAAQAGSPQHKDNQAASLEAGQQQKVYAPGPELLTLQGGTGRIPENVLPQLVRTTNELTQQMAGHFLAQDPLDWRVYLMHRAGLWATIMQLPEATAEQVTQLRALPKDKTLGYEAAIHARQYAAVLVNLEKSAGRAPFWFDGHYLVYRCLDALGAESAKTIVKTMLRLFIERFPVLLEYRFHDGTPFASAETKSFCAELQKNEQIGESDGLWEADSLPVADDEGGSTENALAEAIKLAKKEGFEAGMALIGMRPAARTRASVKHAVLAARFCMAAKRNKAARQLLAAAYEQLDLWGVLEWEPELTAQIITLLLAASKGKISRSQESMLQKLHWLHFETALRVVPEE